MARRVVLHIGPRKTATTYLQRVLQQCVESGALPAECYPIRTRGRLDHNHVPGLIDLVHGKGEIGLQDDAWTEQDGREARALLDAVAATDAEVILSAEALSVLRPSGVESVIAALSPAPVDVVVTMRDLGRVLPSSWQQHMRNGNIESYADYLSLRAEERSARLDRTDLHRGFWRAYRYAELVRRWADAARSVSVVTVPASSKDPAEVWRRFIAAAKLTELPHEPPTVEDDRANISLTGAETFALQGLNIAARGSGLGRREVRDWHRKLLRRGWTDRADRGPRLGLPPEMISLVRAWADEDSADLATSGVPIFGALDDLTVGPDNPGIPDAPAVAASAGAALALALRGRRDGGDT